MAAVSPASPTAASAQQKLDEIANEGGGGGGSSPGIPLSRAASFSSTAPRSPAHSASADGRDKAASAAAAEAEAAPPYVLQINAPVRMNFAAFTKDSYAKLALRERALKERLERKIKNEEGRLVNGEIVFDDEDDEDFLKTNSNPKLAEGQPLPEKFGRFPKDLLGKPIEEVDHYIKYKTFLVISKSAGRNMIGRYSASNSLFCFAPWNPVRKAIIQMTTNQFFDYFILLVIIIGCITMALDEDVFTPVSPPFEYSSLIIYTLEFVFKAIARGFILNKHAYLRDPWSYIDFVVIIISWLATILPLVQTSGTSVGFLKVLRALRVLRAIKGISVVPGLRMIINTVINSVGQLAEAFGLAFFIMIIFTLIGMQLYSGALNQKCVDMGNFGQVNESLVDIEYYLHINNASNWLGGEFNDDWDYLMCGNDTGAYNCSDFLNGSVCLSVGENPNWNYTHFDNFGYALLNVFQILTMDRWEDILNKLVRVKGPYVVFYLLLLIFFGAFYVINLILAVVRNAYGTEASEEARIVAEEEAEEAARAKRNENTALLFDPTKLKERLSSQQHSAADAASIVNAPTAESSSTVKPSTATVATPPQIVINDGCSLLQPEDGGQRSAEFDEQLKLEAASSRSMYHLNVDGDRDKESASPTPSHLSGTEDVDVEMIAEDISSLDNRHKRYLLQKFATLWLNKIKSEDDQLIDRNCTGCGKIGFNGYHDWIKLQNMVFKVATDGLFELFVTLCIVANTAVMASEFDSMTEYHRTANEIANQVFTWIFTVEAVLKIIALSKEYFKNTWNLLDLIVVIFSLLDFIFAYAPLNRANKKSMKSVLKIMKIFRLLRIMKLAQSWSTLRSLLETIFSTISALVYVALVLFIILFLFAVLGSQLLGDGYNNFDYIQRGLNTTYVYDYHGSMPRWNFIDFPHSLLVVFHVICMAWIELCWDCMNANPESKYLCLIIFILTLVLGQFLMLNLFLASLLDAFSGDNVKKEKTVKQESKLKKSLMRIKHCFKKSSGASSKRSITPASFFSDRNSIAASKMTMRRPSLIKVEGAQVVNESHVSMKSGLPLDASLVLQAKSQASMRSSATPVQALSRPELTQLGLTTDLIIDGKETAALSVTTKASSGVLHKTDPEISAMNLQNIEQAFQTHRDHYARFESAVVASQLGTSPMLRGPVIIAEDFSDNPDVRKTIFLHGGTDAADGDMMESSSEDEEENAEQQEGTKEEEEEVDDRVRKMKEVEQKAREADQGELQKTATGEVIVPSCCFAVCYTSCTCCNTVCTTRWTDFRQVCLKICTNSIFEWFIMVIIILSSLTLALEDVYLEQTPVLETILTNTNFVFTAIFIIEMTVKLFGLGFQKYLTSGWSLLDGAIVTISIVDIIMSLIPNLSKLTFLKALRTFRALRPLRAVSRWEGMKIVVNSLLFAMPAIFNVLLVCMLFGLIFSILGVQLFAGKYYACYDPENDPSSPIVNDRYWLPLYNMSGHYTNVTDIISCLNQDYTWRNRLVNFDNVINGYIALYQLVTFEGWMELMQSSVDSKDEIGLQPTPENNLSYYAFIVVFIFIGSFFSLNLFIGVIIDNFNMLKKQYDGSYLSALLTESQRGYFNTLKQLASKKPQKTIRRPKARLLAFFFDLSNSRKFDILSMTVIFLNLVVMMLEDPNSSPTTKLVSKRLNTVFTFFFLAEAVVKLLGYRAHYFRRAWNNFDLIIVAFSTLSEILDFMGGSLDLQISPTMLRIIRVFRVGRILRLIKSMRGVRKLLFTLISALPGLFNIAVLLFLFMFIFSIICMSQFKNMEINQQVFPALTSTVNFRTWFSSFSLLFRLSTVAGWNDICNALMVQPPFCNKTTYFMPNGTAVNDSVGTCGSSVTAPIILMLYMFVTNIIIVNMYIAVILESYDNANEQEETGIVDDDIDMFYNVWETHDPLATQYIPVSQASSLLDSLEPPLRVPKPNGMAIVAFNLPITEGERLHCLDLLMALVKRALHNDEENDPSMTPEQKEANEKLKQQIAFKYKATFPQRLKTRVISTTMQRKKEDVAAKTLQRAWRRHKVQKNIMNIKELALAQTQKEAAEEDARSLKRKLSNVLDSARTRIGSAMGRLSRSGSVHSVRSVDSNALHASERGGEQT